MTPEEFETGLDRWGGDLQLWPAPQRLLAVTLLAGSPAARHAHAAMLAVEGALRRTARRPVPVLDNLPARATAAPQERSVALAWRLRYAVSLTLLVAGFAYGALSQAPPEDWFSAAFTSPEPFDVN
jgi:hypothetical protein